MWGNKLRDMAISFPAPKLPIVLRPEPGENVHGFLSRLAEANGHRGMVAFTRALGLGAGFGPTSASNAWSRLAKATDLADNEVSAMRWISADRTRYGAKIVVAGVETALGFVYPRTTRLCLSCLRETGIRRDFWSFAAVAACPRHGTLLTTQCSCGRILPAGSYGRTHECACGTALERLEEIPAPAAVVRIARNLAARVGVLSGYKCENDFDAPFQTLCAHDFMATVYTLGLATTTLASEDTRVQRATGSYPMSASRNVPTIAMTVARLVGATRIMDGWPDAYVALLKKVEGRNVEADRTNIAGAFATSIGRLLVCPVRGADGLPLRFLCQMLDEYWSNNTRIARRRRRRNPTTRDVTARRLHASFKISDLARVLNLPHGTAFVGRILSRVLEQRSCDDLALSNDALVSLVRERAVALYHAAVVSLSSEGASDILEGIRPSRALSGWEHPNLLPADPTLFSLRLKGKRAYAPEAVHATLSRLQAVTCRVNSTVDLVSLVSVGFHHHTQSCYNKTDMLLDIMESRLSIYSSVDDPTLSDLLVSLDELRQARCARSPVNQTPDGFATPKQINIVLQGRFGAKECLTRNEFRRLARSRQVKFKVVNGAIESLTLPRPVRFYNVNDVVDFVSRRTSDGGLGIREAASFGRLSDIAPLLKALHATGMTTTRMAVELTTRGVRTQDGAPWGHKFVSRALDLLQTGQKVPGLLTGRSFAEGMTIPVVPPKKSPEICLGPHIHRDSDIDDKEWTLLAPHLRLQSEGAWHRKYPLRDIFNGLRYLAANQSGWSSLPADLPPWYTILSHFRRWLAAGRFEVAMTALRAEIRSRSTFVKREQSSSPVVFIDKQAAAQEQPGGHSSQTSLAFLRRTIDDLSHVLSLVAAFD